jgi:hypothetical protein
MRLFGAVSYRESFAQNGSKFFKSPLAPLSKGGLGGFFKVFVEAETQPFWFRQFRVRPYFYGFGNGEWG